MVKWPPPLICACRAAPAKLVSAAHFSDPPLPRTRVPLPFLCRAGPRQGQLLPAARQGAGGGARRPSGGGHLGACEGGLGQQWVRGTVSRAEVQGAAAACAHAVGRPGLCARAAITSRVAQSACTDTAQKASELLPHRRRPALCGRPRQRPRAMRWGSRTGRGPSARPPPLALLPARARQGSGARARAARWCPSPRWGHRVGGDMTRGPQCCVVCSHRWVRCSGHELCCLRPVRPCRIGAVLQSATSITVHVISRGLHWGVFDPLGSKLFRSPERSS